MSCSKCDVLYLDFAQSDKSYPYTLLHSEGCIHDENINEPILERGMTRLIHEIKIIFWNTTKIARPRPLNADKPSKIMKIAEILGSGAEKFASFENISDLFIRLIIPLSKMGSLIFLSWIYTSQWIKMFGRVSSQIWAIQSQHLQFYSEKRS